MEARRAATTGGAASYVRISVTYVASISILSTGITKIPSFLVSTSSILRNVSSPSTISPNIAYSPSKCFASPKKIEKLLVALSASVHLAIDSVPRACRQRPARVPSHVRPRWT